MHESVFRSGPTSWNFADTLAKAWARGVLGECLTKQGADRSLTVAVRIEKLREAEALLIEWTNALQGDDKTPEDRKTEVIQRVVDLYEAWDAAEPDHGYDAQADEWRAKLPKAQPDDRGDGNGIGDDE